MLQGRAGLAWAVRTPMERRERAAFVVKYLFGGREAERMPLVLALLVWAIRGRWDMVRVIAKGRGYGELTHGVVGPD